MTHWKGWWLGAAVLLAAVAAFLPAIAAGWIWDDDSYVTRNPVVAAADGWWRVFVPRTTPQYYPLVFLGFWIERRLWGLEPAAFHAVNVLLHATNALLAWRLARALALPGAWWVAALFALHPVHVESVAWVAERKNVLSTALYLAAALAWLRFDRGDPDPVAPRASEPPRWRWYAISLGCFVLALLSKTVACSLPAALLLMTAWRHLAPTRRRLLLLVPFFAIGIALGLHTAALERTLVGARGPDFDLSFVERLAIASRALWFYAAKLLAPVRLSFVYPRWEIDAASLVTWMPAAGLAVVAGCVIVAWRRGTRGPALGAAFFAGTLFPALGFFDVYPMRYSFVADHFQYLASLGFLALVVAAVARLPVSLLRSTTARTAGVALLALLATLTWQRCFAFADAKTLWRETLRVNPAAWIAHNNLAQIDLDEGRAQEALARIEAALPLTASERARNQLRRNRGIALGKIGRHAEAVAEFEALERAGEPIELHLALALDRLGRSEEAEPMYRRAAVRGDDPFAWLMLGVHFLGRGMPERAIEPLEASIALQPDSIDARMVLADAFASAGRRDEAIATAQAALHIAESSPDPPPLAPLRRRLAQLRGAPR